MRAGARENEGKEVGEIKGKKAEEREQESGARGVRRGAAKK